MNLDLPLIWAGLIALAVLMYVLLDGFDLGLGILFPFARDPRHRDAMMHSIAPVWDGNETWLVLGGGGLLAAFPYAYSLIMPALYVPVILMLLALILRGVAFEFRLRGRHHGKRFWTAAFAGGSLVAAAAQGMILGGFIQGIAVEDGAFAGRTFDWLTPYSLLTAAGVVAGYALLGAGWLIVKAEGDLHDDARRWAWSSAIAVAVALAAVSLATLVVHPQVAERWGFSGWSVDFAVLGPLLAIPAVGLIGLALVVYGLRSGSHRLPFAGAFVVFLSGYLGLGWSLYPDAVPYGIGFREAANADNALGLMLVGVAILLPVILGYTVWVYWVFRGKVSADASYDH
ncbi:MAG TPA: cytochrome d ubiquinol oxidase subunit II [Caulobacteraceae bacterium]